jgi:hypothetical protein
LEAFLPGLELFLKYQNSALIRYQLLNFVDKNDGNVIGAKITPLWYFVVEKHCSKHTFLGQNLTKKILTGTVM